MLGFSPISAAPISWPGNFVISLGGIAAGATLSGTSTLSAGSATGDSGAGDATAPGATLNGASSIAPGAATVDATATGSISDADITRIVQAVLAALNATTIPVDTRKMNGSAVIGDGSEAQPWRGFGVQP